MIQHIREKRHCHIHSRNTSNSLKNHSHTDNHKIMYIDKAYQTTDNRETKSHYNRTLFTKFMSNRPCHYHSYSSRNSSKQSQCRHQCSGSLFRIGRIDDAVKHPSCIKAHGTVFHQLSKLKQQEIQNDDPPVFAVNTRLHLFFQRNLLFLDIQVQCLLCNTFSCKIIFQKDSKETTYTQCNRNNSPVRIACINIQSLISGNKKITL